MEESSLLAMLHLFPANFQPTPGQSPSLPASVSSLASGPEVVTRWDQQGFPILVTIDATASPGPPSYDSRGFLITATTAPTQVAGVGVVQADRTSTTGFMFPSVVRANGARSTAIPRDLAAVIGIEVLAAVAAVVVCFRDLF